MTELAADQETRAEADEKPREAKFWLGELVAAAKRDEGWHKLADKVIERYRDERGEATSGDQRINILWSNTEILKGALFQGLGKPDVRRRFSNRGVEDKAARQTAVLLERALSYCRDAYEADQEVEAAVEDHLLPGRGVVWVVYEATVEDGETPGGDDYEDEPNPNAGPQITDQSAKLEYVFWQDWRCSYARTWSGVWWVARRHFYTRDDLRKYWPDHADKVPLNARVQGAPDTTEARDQDDTFKRAAVWEIWDKSKKERVYVAEDYPLVLGAEDDPYQLERFFPCPEPLYSVKTTSSMAPIPEFLQYKDQANELDEIATRLYNLVEGCKRRGAYAAEIDGADSQLANLMHASDNEFIPVKNWAALMEAGGLSSVFQTEDLAPTIAAINVLYEKAAATMQRIYEVTGISDVLRGASNPNETATAQRIKGQFGSLRLDKRRERVHRFIRDGYRLKAELIAEHYTREKLSAMTGMDLPLAQEVEAAKQQLAMLQQAMQAQQQPQQPGMPPQPMLMPAMEPADIKRLQVLADTVPWEQIEAILRSDRRRGYVIDVESEATAEVDDAAEKAARIEFTTGIVQLMERLLPAAMMQPKLVPFARELTIFSLRAFKIGRSLEESVDDFYDSLEEQAKQAPQGPPPDPKAEAEAERLKVQTEAMKAKAQADMQRAQIDGQAKVLDLGVKQREAQTRAQLGELELGMKAAEAQRAQKMGEIDLGLKLRDALMPKAPPEAAE